MKKSLRLTTASLSFIQAAGTFDIDSLSLLQVQARVQSHAPTIPPHRDDGEHGVFVDNFVSSVLVGWKDAFADFPANAELVRAPATPQPRVDFSSLWLDDVATFAAFVLLAHVMFSRVLFRFCAYFDEAGRARLTVALASVVGWGLYSIATITLYFAFHFFEIMSSEGLRRPSLQAQKCFAAVCFGTLLRIYSTFLVFYGRSASDGVPKQDTFGLVDTAAPDSEPPPVLRMLEADKFQSSVVKVGGFLVYTLGNFLGIAGAAGLAVCVHQALREANLGHVAPSIYCAIVAASLYTVSVLTCELSRSVASWRNSWKRWRGHSPLVDRAGHVLDAVSTTAVDVVAAGTAAASSATSAAARAAHSAAAIAMSRGGAGTVVMAPPGEGISEPRRDVMALEVGSFECAALGAASVARLGPVMGILYLITWVRCLELNPPDGYPLESWMPACLYFTVACLTVQTAFGFFAGLWGDEPADALGVKVTDTNRLSCMLVQFCSGGVFLGLAPTIHKFYRELPSFSSGSGALHSALALSILFWLVLSLQWLAGMVLFVMRKNLAKQLVDDFRLAAFKVSACPALIGLYCICWFRAYTLTGGSGSPQGWALDFMMSSAFFVILETAPRLFLAIWRGGEPVSSSFPKMQYVSSFVEAFSFAWLEFGIVAVIGALYAMTPSTATAASRGSQLEYILLAISCFFAVLLSIGKLITVSVKLGIDRLNHGNSLGADIVIGDLLVSLYDGYVSVDNVVIENPREIKDKCCSENIFSVEHIGLDVDTGMLIRSFGTTLDVKRVAVRSLHFNFEVPFGRKSNYWHLLHAAGGDTSGCMSTICSKVGIVASRACPQTAALMEKRRQQQEAAAKAKAEDDQKAVEEAKQAEKERAKAAGEDAKGGIEFSMPSSIHLEDIAASATFWGATVVLQLGDIIEDDLRAPKSTMDTLKVVGQVMVFVAETVFRSFKADVALVARGSVRTAAQLAHADWSGAERIFHGEVQEVSKTLDMNVENKSARARDRTPRGRRSA